MNKTCIIVIASVCSTVALLTGISGGGLRALSSKAVFLARLSPIHEPPGLAVATFPVAQTGTAIIPTRAPGAEVGQHRSIRVRPNLTEEDMETVGRSKFVSIELIAFDAGVFHGPPNSVLAARRAIADGATSLNVDLVLTADDRLVGAHSETEWWGAAAFPPRAKDISATKLADVEKSPTCDEFKRSWLQAGAEEEDVESLMPCGAQTVNTAEDFLHAFPATRIYFDLKSKSFDRQAKSAMLLQALIAQYPDRAADSELTYIRFFAKGDVVGLWRTLSPGIAPFSLALGGGHNRLASRSLLESSRFVPEGWDVAQSGKAVVFLELGDLAPAARSFKIAGNMKFVCDLAATELKRGREAEADLQRCIEFGTMAIHTARVNSSVRPLRKWCAWPSPHPVVWNVTLPSNQTDSHEAMRHGHSRKSKLGLSLLRGREGLPGLMITSVRGGLIQGYNAAHPDTMVKSGDFIIAVNGEEESSDVMQMLLKMAATVSMTVLRLPPGQAPDPTNLKGKRFASMQTSSRTLGNLTAKQCKIERSKVDGDFAEKRGVVLLHQPESGGEVDRFQMGLLNSPAPTPSTWMRCAGKLATSMLVLRLVELGKLPGLDEPIVQFLRLEWDPELTGGVTPNNTALGGLTLRHVMLNVGGLPVWTWSPEWAKDKIRPNVELCQRALLAIPNGFRLGSFFKYSNMAWAVVERAVEVGTGLAFHDAGRQYLFDPLGISELTHYEQDGVQGCPQSKGDKFYQHNYRAAIGLCITAEDLLVLAKALRSKESGPTRFLSEQAVREVVLDQMAERFPAALPSYLDNPPVTEFEKQGISRIVGRAMSGYRLHNNWLMPFGGPLGHLGQRVLLKEGVDGLGGELLVQYVFRELGTDFPTRGGFNLKTFLGAADASFRSNPAGFNATRSLCQSFSVSRLGQKHSPHQRQHGHGSRDRGRARADEHNREGESDRESENESDPGDGRRQEAVDIIL